MISSVALFTLGAAPALAETAAPAEATTVSEVVITGSRIPQPNLTSISPVSAVNAQQIQLQGISNVEDLINNLPQAVGDYGAFESNGASGTSTINLRGLGNKRTMVLVNGVRLPPGDPTASYPTSSVAPDVNMIPPGLIDRVEVLTGGASAVYGSDAVAGVVNFIMKKNFEGLQIDEQTSISQDGGGDKQVRTADANGHSAIGFPSIKFPGNAWDGLRQTTTIIGGANSPNGKGNVEFYLGYTYIQAVKQSQRDYSICSLATDNTSTSFQYCGGSSTDATGRLKPTSGPNAGHSFNILGTPVAGVLPGFNYGQGFNYAPYNYLQRPDQRYTAGEFSTYEVNKFVNLYSSFMFMDDHTRAQIAPSGSFFGDSVYTIPCADPLLSGPQANTLCGPGPYSNGQTGTAEIGRRNVEGGPRFADLEHMNYRIQFGSKGDLGDGWNYDLSGLYGRSVLTESEGGYLLISHLEKALNVVSVGGVPTCASNVAGADPHCVPYNIWSPGGVTPQAIDYLTGNALNSGSTTTQIVTLTFSNADLSRYGLKSPAARDGVGFSGGFEYHREALETSYDSLVQSGDLAGFGGSISNTSGSQTDKDVFVELRAPLVQDLKGIEDLSLEAGYRYADYTHGGGNNTYKVGLDWQTTPDLRLRGSYEVAVRAPNVQELFQTSVPGLFAGSDPCAGSSPTFTAAQCANTFQVAIPGITGPQLISQGIYGSIPQCVSAQCGEFAGGNPDLKPETADTYSFGFVFTPTFFKNFNLTVDYWDINVKKAIIYLYPNVILTNCGVTGNAFDCAQINRFAAGGYSVYGGAGQGGVNLPLVNASSLSTRGVDVSANYRANLDDWRLKGAGSLAFAFTGTYTQTYKTQLPDNTSFDCAGLYGVTCGVPMPKWRHQLRVTWNSPWNVNLSVAWRYIQGTSLDFNTSQPDLQFGAFKDVLPTDAHIPNYNYVDLAFTWKARDNVTVRGGVSNVGDARPPLLDANSFGISSPPFGNGNTYPQVYDPLGRVFFMGLTLDL